MPKAYPARNEIDVSERKIGDDAHDCFERKTADIAGIFAHRAVVAEEKDFPFFHLHERKALRHALCVRFLEGGKLLFIRLFQPDGAAARIDFVPFAGDDPLDDEAHLPRLVRKTPGIVRHVQDDDIPSLGRPLDVALERCAVLARVLHTSPLQPSR